MLKFLVVLAASTLLFSSPALGSALSAKDQEKLEAYRAQLEAEEGEGLIRTIPPNDISSTTTDPLPSITTTVFPPDISSGPASVVNNPQVRLENYGEWLLEAKCFRMDSEDPGRFTRKIKLRYGCFWHWDHLGNSRSVCGQSKAAKV